ncbi:hypothetical protein BS17DRAFT_849752 [Gyrodon lividus]|nr:hypothetical protein BS17DRAFT_849752 [Gyrodon lividus]
MTGRICDEHGNYIDPNTPPPPISEKSPDDWTPYQNKTEFEAAELIFKEAQLSAGKTDKLLHIWGLTLAVHGDKLPFSDHQDLYDTIDVTPVGDIPWNSLKLQYNGEQPVACVSPWMNKPYGFWFQKPSAIAEGMLSNRDFDGEIDYDDIAKNEDACGAVFVPIILGSDKTTVSVATGQNDYWPVYLSIGNIHNNIQRAHCNAVALIVFLAIPKAPNCPSQTGLNPGVD